MSTDQAQVTNHQDFGLHGDMTAPMTSSFKFLPRGATIQEFRVGGINIVQNFHTAEQYKKYNAPYFGETIGRVANRISGAKIKSLNGRSYQLAANNGPNSLHGGVMGWGKRIFDGPTPVNRNGKEAVLFKYLSKDGEEGYPGTVEVRVWYTSSTTQDPEKGKPVTVLEAEYEAEMLGDEDIEETAVGVTNHR
jgi:aldose 1-epimerase